MVLLAHGLFCTVELFQLTVVLYEKEKYTNFSVCIVVKKYFIQKQGCDLFNSPILLNQTCNLESTAQIFI